MPNDNLALDLSGNPTNEVNLNFQNYLDERNRQLNVHLVNGIPDYAFSLDQQLRQAGGDSARSLPGARDCVFESRVYETSHAARRCHRHAETDPEIYEMAQDCSKTLGIGTPEVFIKFSPTPNAYTLASDQANDMIVFHSSLVEMATADELKFIMGHECGHIHNQHSVYNVAAEILTNPALNLIAVGIPALGTAIKLAAGALGLFFKHWSRAAEVTCDRAGAICTGSIEVGQTSLAKLATGGGTAYGKIDIGEYMKQLDRTQKTPLRLLELTASHPLIPKRLKALELFGESDVLYKWRPEMRTGSETLRSIEEVDKDCAQQIRVL